MWGALGPGLLGLCLKRALYPRCFDPDEKHDEPPKILFFVHLVFKRILLFWLEIFG